jgi:hypothetical protein
MEALKYNRWIDEDTNLVIALPASYRKQEVEIIVLKKGAHTPVSEIEVENSSDDVLTLEEKKAILAKFKGSMPAQLPPDIDLEEEWYLQ